MYIDLSLYIVILFIGLLILFRRYMDTAQLYLRRIEEEQKNNENAINLLKGAFRNLQLEISATDTSIRTLSDGIRRLELDIANLRKNQSDL